MNTPVLKMHSPYEVLFGIPPNYALLQTFDCLCYLNLRPYTTHKFTTHSEHYIFLGYSSRHLRYRCLSLQSGKLFISRDVVFNETCFPFAENSPLISSLPSSPNNGSILDSILLCYPPITPSALESSSPSSSSPSFPMTHDLSPVALGDSPESLSPPPCRPPKYKTLQHLYQVTTTQSPIPRGSPSLETLPSPPTTNYCSKYLLLQCFVTTPLPHVEPTSLSSTLHNPN